ncbi:hypothetical protein [Paludisphaera mucosa]|uniref:Uncharacterized protein n=1 Tax=Paludisphaera mucosa TaxID=3030827 RepID=A0ABT6FJJ9_9BACT|nr:hypothetical protein [Paludisphaera mucosa]MDG3007748.1 hypothetical protein [Paludisphaera mucosa]
MDHARRAGGWAALMTLLSLCTPAPEAAATEDAAAVAPRAAPSNAPDDVESFAAYRSDRSNQEVQTWGQYRGWVRTFYDGNMMSDGWRKFGEVTVGAVKSEAARQSVAAQVAELGRIIGHEWAKDSSVRKISTTDLRRWNEMIASARRSDDGSGGRTLDALRAVRRTAEDRCRRG